MVTVSISSPSQLDIAPWRDLVVRASSNVFMEPAALKAAVETKFADIQVLQAWEQGGAEPPRLVGLWALQRRKVAWFWPTLLEALPYTYAFLSSPVIDPLFVADVIPAFFAAIAASTLPKVLSLQSFDAESQGYAAMVAHGAVPLRLAEGARPMATRAFGIKKSGSTRKKLRQDWNRLSALGQVDVVNERAPAEVRRAFEIFLTMEAASWKGAQGTALLSDVRDASFVRRLAGDLAEQGSASVALLQVDGRPIAAQVLMYSGATAYTWKTAYDSKFAKFSPGALLIDKVAEAMFATPGIDTIDSCSAADSFMAQLWEGRRSMADLLVKVSPGGSLGFALESARLRGYHELRNLRNRLKAWQAARKRKPAAPVAPSNS